MLKKIMLSNVFDIFFIPKCASLCPANFFLGNKNNKRNFKKSLMFSNTVENFVDLEVVILED